MSYSFYSFRNREQQDTVMWANESFDSLVSSSKNRKLHKIFEKHLNKQHMKILEGGCGMGTWVYNLRLKGHDVIGVDYMDSTIEKLRKYDASLPVFQGDVNNLDFPDDSFDAYISLGVIEHFQEGPQKALSEAYRILRPGGIAFITVPYLNVLRRLITHPMRDLFFLIRKAGGKKKYFWEYRYTKEELSNFIERSGFEIIDIDIDDYIKEDKNHHIGLYADFFFLRSKNGELWQLNNIGKILLGILKLFSPWYYCSGLHIVARKPN